MNLRGYVPVNRLGALLRSAREARGLYVRDVVQLAGLKDDAPTRKALWRWEYDGVGDERLYMAAARALGISEAQIEQAREQMREDLRAWLSEPVEPELVLRALPAIYLPLPLPAGLSRNGLIEHCRSLLRTRFRSFPPDYGWVLCLNLSRTEAIYFRADGSCRLAVDQVNGVALPRSFIGGKPLGLGPIVGEP